MMLKKVLRYILAVISAVFLIWFLLPLCWGVWHIGCVIGVLLSLALFLRTAFAKVYHRIRRNMYQKKHTLIIMRAIQIGSIAVLAYCIVVSSFMIYAMLPWSRNDNATAVVLGAQVKPYGPSTLLRQRIDAAEVYLREKPDADAVVTGGQGSNEHMSEAECMYENMVKDGIAADRIYQEDQAKNTDENIRFSLKVIEENKLNKNIAVVTDSYHQLRARIVAMKADSSIEITPINTTNSYAAGVATYPSYFVREWLAIPVELIK